MRSESEQSIVNLLYRGTSTIQEFQWDNMTTTPMMMLITPEDIGYIRNLILSPRYSGNNNFKMDKIDEIMNARGFSRFAGGTNRLVYSHPSAPNAVFKVAIDSVGISDNPAEYRNQEFLKPYCCKVFECSPCGTIASFEKVERITTVEEFYSIADDYFYILSRVILGKYIMEDIGIDYFMNIGIRRGCYPVILDFPYLFELDGNKLECCNILDDGTVCHGEIDYDDGFNKLVCKKCGRVYHARDLAKPPKESSVLLRNKGVQKMKITAYKDGKIVRCVNTEGEQSYVSPEPQTPDMQETLDAVANGMTVIHIDLKTKTKKIYRPNEPIPNENHHPVNNSVCDNNGIIVSKTYNPEPQQEQSEECTNTNIDSNGSYEEEQPIDEEINMNVNEKLSFMIDGICDYYHNLTQEDKDSIDPRVFGKVMMVFDEVLKNFEKQYPETNNKNNEVEETKELVVEDEDKPKTKEEEKLETESTMEEVKEPVVEDEDKPVEDEKETEPVHDNTKHASDKISLIPVTPMKPAIFFDDDSDKDVVEVQKNPLYNDETNFELELEKINPTSVVYTKDLDNLENPSNNVVYVVPIEQKDCEEDSSSEIEETSPEDIDQTRYELYIYNESLDGFIRIGYNYDEERFDIYEDDNDEGCIIKYVSKSLDDIKDPKEGVYYVMKKGRKHFNDRVFSDREEDENRKEVESLDNPDDINLNKYKVFIYEKEKDTDKYHFVECYRNTKASDSLVGKSDKLDIDDILRSKGII